jgi:hypothetical protein
MFENRLKPLNQSESGNSSGLGLAEVSPSSSRAGGGKVIHDARGNAVWKWGVATGVFAAIKPNELLNMLENPTLALEGDCQVGADEWAGDPYNRR